MKKIILSFVFIWFFIGSLAHFIFSGSEAKIIPDYIPWHMADVYVSGFLEMLGALWLLSKKTRPYAGFGLFCLTIAVTPAKRKTSSQSWPVYTFRNSWRPRIMRSKAMAG